MRISQYTNEVLEREGKFYPDQMKLRHLQLVQQGECKLLSKDDVLRVSGTTMRGLLPQIISVIEAVKQIPDFAEYMPPGPDYSESERKWSIIVLNSIAPQSMDMCWAQTRQLVQNLTEIQKQTYQQKEGYLTTPKGSEELKAACLRIRKLETPEDFDYALLKYHFLKIKATFATALTKVVTLDNKVFIQWNVSKTRTTVPSAESGMLTEGIKKAAEKVQLFAILLGTVEMVSDPTGIFVTEFTIPANITKASTAIETSWISTIGTRSFDPIGISLDNLKIFNKIQGAVSVASGVADEVRLEEFKKICAEASKQKAEAKKQDEQKKAAQGKQVKNQPSSSIMSGPVNKTFKYQKKPGQEDQISSLLDNQNVRGEEDQNMDEDNEDDYLMHDIPKNSAQVDRGDIPITEFNKVPEKTFVQLVQKLVHDKSSVIQCRCKDYQYNSNSRFFVCQSHFGQLRCASCQNMPCLMCGSSVNVPTNSAHVLAQLFDENQKASLITEFTKLHGDMKTATNTPEK